MHELAISRNILAIVEEAAKGRRVRRITLDIGKLSGVMSQAVAFCFDAVARGTALEGTSLDICEIEGRCRCRDCGLEFAADTLYQPCPCGSHRLDRLQGEELKIRTMELEEAI